MEKYQELAFEIRRIHGASKVTIIPIMIGALGSISKSAKTWFGKLDIPDFLGSCAIIGHSWNCPPVAESVVSLSYGELLRTIKTAQQKTWRELYNNDNNSITLFMSQAFYRSAEMLLIGEIK